MGDRGLRFHSTEQGSLLPLCLHCWVLDSLIMSFFAELWITVGQTCIQVSAHSGASNLRSCPSFSWGHKVVVSEDAFFLLS